MVIKPSTHFWSGNEACVEGAIISGCRFFSGYPISPANEIPERLSERLPLIGGIFIQMRASLLLNSDFNRFYSTTILPSKHLDT